MSDPRSPRVAIVDYGLGNLYSVAHACRHVGLASEITSAPAVLTNADAVILPGVGAFGDAMDNLRRRDLVAVLRDVAQSPVPLVGICLGMQLLMSESYEFGHHHGLGIVEGEVVPLSREPVSGRSVKVPQIGWNRVSPVDGRGESEAAWKATLLSAIPAGEYMYFVHSFVVRPADPRTALAKTRYGTNEFCSALAHRNVFASQFHPERSGPPGLSIYSSLAAEINALRGGAII